MPLSQSKQNFREACDVAGYVKVERVFEFGGHPSRNYFWMQIHGWENAPFLFVRTEAGWQFDIVHQRKYIRMGRSPKWGIERADYPYIELLARCPYFMGQDIPLADEDRHRVEADDEIARRIVDLEN
jgi:hypothetical protein